MGIKDEIFEEFFKKLEEDDDFPNIVIQELKNLFESRENISQEKIFNAIKKGCRNVSTNQEN